MCGAGLHPHPPLLPGRIYRSFEETLRCVLPERRPLFRLIWAHCILSPLVPPKISPRSHARRDCFGRWRGRQERHRADCCKERQRRRFIDGGVSSIYTLSRFHSLTIDLRPGKYSALFSPWCLSTACRTPLPSLIQGRLIDTPFINLNGWLLKDLL